MNKNYIHTIVASRLGLQNAPIGQTKHNLGVEYGGREIAQKLKKSYKGHINRLLEFNFPEPEKLSGNHFLKEILNGYQKASGEVLREWNNETLVTLGGDHSSAYVSLAAVLEKKKANNVGVIMFDSHADIHLPETSPSGNFHGMWLRSFLDKFPDSKNKKIDPKQIKYVGNLEMEKEEENFIRKNKIDVYSSKEITKEKSKELFKWTKNFDHLHISFDVDTLKEELVPATGTPNPNGLSQEELMMMIKHLPSHRSISLDITEYNPYKKGLRKSLSIINTIYKTLFSL